MRRHIILPCALLALATIAATGTDSQVSEQPRTTSLTPTEARAAAPSDTQRIILDAFAPLGPDSQSWALRVAGCESGYNPNAVNPSSGASGLFQFLPSTWSSSPYAGQSPFDPVANSHAAAWLYSRSGPAAWECK
jgi:soluble lytic murein transglycosylase-like protein